MSIENQELFDEQILLNTVKPIKIELIDNATNGVKFDITLDDLEDMAQCIHNCSWVSIDELFAYMKATVTGS